MFIRVLTETPAAQFVTLPSRAKMLDNGPLAFNLFRQSLSMLLQCRNYLLCFTMFADPLVKCSLHFIGGGRRGFRRLRNFFDVSGKSLRPLDETRIGFGIANFESAGTLELLIRFSRGVRHSAANGSLRKLNKDRRAASGVSTKSEYRNRKTTRGP